MLQPFSPSGACFLRQAAPCCYREFCPEHCNCNLPGCHRMSTAPENEFDLEKLFLPAWAQEPSAAKYAKYEGGEDLRGRRDDRRGGRPPRQERRPGPRRDEQRPRGERAGPHAFKDD